MRGMRNPLVASYYAAVAALAASILPNDTTRMRLFSYRDRPVHLGPYPLERLTRGDEAPYLSGIAPMQALSFDDPNPESLNHAMARFIGMFDLVRDGSVNAQAGEVPEDPRQRSEHLKAAGITSTPR